ncbi:ABC transporter permease [Haloferula helveola]|uniref:ABC transporter permease n=1 Tax=Haloferula helveola TaxID=490095 RepID=A0ABN6H4P8_9BACT|nr:ABC transporter permease [Haloferula helveola]
MRRFIIPILLAGAGFALAGKLVPAEQTAVNEHLASFPDADVWTHQLRPAVLTGICMIPAVAALFYCLGGTIARYVTRQFLALLAVTFGGLAVIWLLVDFQDNLEEMKASQDVANTALRLYAARLPELTVTLLPYALLLSLLFCLGRLSSSREIVAMIQSGRGLARLTFPFMLAGLLSAFLCAGLNYHWAPRANAAEKKILDTARGLDETAAEVVMFRNPRKPRLWMVGSFPPDYQKGAPLKRVRVVRETPDSKLKSVLIARTASWSPSTGAWSFEDATVRDVPEGDPQPPPLYRTDLPNPYVVKTWRETPAEIIQPGLPANQLGIPDLAGWLASNEGRKPSTKAPYLTQWHHRFAQPFNCLIVVLLATPLGVVFSRRGTSGGVAIAVFLAAGLLFLTTFCLSLGDAGHLQPVIAAWLPNLVFGILALYLFRRRLAGRPIYQTIRRLIPNEA